MSRLPNIVMTAERQTTQNETTSAANEGDAVTPGQSGVAALDRAFSILFAFRPGDYALTLAELAARTGLYKSTILRLARASRETPASAQAAGSCSCTGPCDPTAPQA